MLGGPKAENHEQETRYRIISSVYLRGCAVSSGYLFRKTGLTVLRAIIGFW
jgi:hypothetical protein